MKLFWLSANAGNSMNGKHKYLWFTAKFPTDKARARFVQKHGCAPRQCFVDGNYLKVGPCPQDKPGVTQEKRVINAVS